MVNLPVESQAEILDFAEFLREKKRRKNSEIPLKKSALPDCIKVMVGSAMILTII